MKTMRKAGSSLLFGLGVLGILASGGNAFAQGSKTFTKPMIEGRRLDWCLHWAKECGKPAANAWCRRTMGKADGYALKWQIAPDIGASSPTYVLGDRKICNKAFCDGFKSITCGFSLD